MLAGRAGAVGLGGGSDVAWRIQRSRGGMEREGGDGGTIPVGTQLGLADFIPSALESGPSEFDFVSRTPLCASGDLQL